MAYTCQTHDIHMSNTCQTSVIHMSYTCHTHDIPMSDTCHTQVIHMSYACQTHVIPMAYTCPTHVKHCPFCLTAYVRTSLSRFSSSGEVATSGLTSQQEPPTVSTVTLIPGHTHGMNMATWDTHGLRMEFTWRGGGRYLCQSMTNFKGRAPLPLPLTVPFLTLPRDS